MRRITNKQTQLPFRFRTQSRSEPVRFEIFDSIRKNVTLITVVLIVLGYINLNSYYSWFGINIYHYLDVSEILLSFAQFSIATFFLFIIIFLFIEGPSLIPSDTYSRIFLSKVFIISMTGVTLICCIYNMKATLDSGKNYYVNVDAVKMCCSITAITMSLLIRKILGMENDKLLLRYKNTVAIFSYITLIMFAVTTPNLFLADNLKNGYIKTKAKLTLLNNEKIVTSDAVTYIGMTNNYYFFLGTLGKDVVIIRKDQVLKAQFIKED